jgi:hypothetical protein
MRWMAMLGVVVVWVVAAAAAQAGSGATTDPVQLVGFTSAPFKGGVGVRTLTQACQAEFDAAARMCRSTEVLETVVWPAALTGSAWVMPVYVPGTNGTDASGANSGSPAGLSCAAWSEGGGAGLSVDATGAMQPRDCGNTLSVACCEPVRMPKPSKR